jgi:two-component system, OmpR family, response regulator ChvI
MSISSEEICFIRSDNFCMSFVRMAEPTGIVSNSQNANSDKDKKCYLLFLNIMASIARAFDAKIIKNIGDGLVCYFPKTTDPNNYAAFNDVIWFGLTAIAARRNINTIMNEEKLPTIINFKISVDYGKVEVAETAASGGAEDLFGSSMNLCAKINNMAAINDIAIGHNLYLILRRLFSDSLSFNFDKYYDFQQIGDYFWKDGNQERNSYPIYSLIANNDRNKEDLFANQRPESKQKNTQNIMIVDDERDILITYSAILCEQGYNIKTFSSPHEAVLHFAHADKSHYDLVILDIRMPNLNGLQLYHRLKAIDKDIKILFLSALEVSEEITSVFPELKYGDIIRKPISKEYFVGKINALLH